MTQFVPTLLRRLALGAIVLLAFGVRVYDLGTESVWRDEAYSILTARGTLTEIVSRTVSEDTSPPLYYLVLHEWQRFFGDSPVSARMPSVIAGTVAVVFAYFAAEPLIGPLGGLFAALIHALSPFLVAYSQETRQYAFLSCASLASFCFLIALLNGRRFATAAYVLATILLCYMHSVGSFVLLAQVVYVTGLALVWGSPRWQRALMAQAVAAAAFLPWAFVMWRQYGRIAQDFWVPVPGLYTLLNTHFDYVGSTVLAELCLVLALVGCLRVAPGAPSTVPSRQAARALQEKTWMIRLADLNCTWLLTCWLVIPIMALFVVSRVSTPIYLPRATIAASSAFYLLVARGLTQLRGGLRIAAVITISVLLCGEVAYAYRMVGKEQWDNLVADVSPLVQPGDVFVFHQRKRWDAFNYYFKDSSVRRIGFPDRPFRVDDVVTENDVTTLPDVVDDGTRVWLVVVNSKDRDGLIRSRLLRTRREFFSRSYYGVEVHAFDKAIPADQ